MEKVINFTINTLPEGGKETNRGRIAVSYHDCTPEFCEELIELLGPGESRNSDDNTWLFWDLGTITIDAFFRC